MTLIKAVIFIFLSDPKTLPNEKQIEDRLAEIKGGMHDDINVTDDFVFTWHYTEFGNATWGTDRSISLQMPICCVFNALRPDQIGWYFWYTVFFDCILLNEKF